MIIQTITLLFGVFACSTSILFIKISTENSVLLSAYRLLVAAIILTPVFLKNLKKHKDNFGWRELQASLLPGVSLGLHFIAWIIGARMTMVTNATLIVNMVPVVMPFFLFILFKEIVNRWEIIGSIIALVGILILSGGDFHLNNQTFQGDLLCFIAMLLFAFYLALGRKNKDHINIWLYLVPLYYIAGIFCFLISLFAVNPIKNYTLKNLLLILGLGIVPTVIGHSILNYSMKHFRGQIVSIINLSQFIFAGIMGYFILGEIPKNLFYISAILVASGSILVIKFGEIE